MSWLCAAQLPWRVVPAHRRSNSPADYVLVNSYTPYEKCALFIAVQYFIAVQEAEDDL